MAASTTSSESEMEERNNKQKMPRKKREDNNNVVKLVTRGKLSGRFSQSLFRKLPPLVRIPLRDIVSEEEVLRAGHIFLGFTRSGRHILSYTREAVGSSDEEGGVVYSFNLYWWEFNLRSPLRQVQHVDVFGYELTECDHIAVCEWPGNDDSKLVVCAFNARSNNNTAQAQLMINLFKCEDGFYGDFPITVVSNPPSKHCSRCRPDPASAPTTMRGGQCLEHGYTFKCRYLGDSPSPFQPALQLKKNEVFLMRHSDELVACAISFCPAGEGSPQVLHNNKRAAAAPSTSGGQPSADLTSASPSTPPSSTLPQESAEGTYTSYRTPASPASSSASSPSHSSLSQESNLGEDWETRYVDYTRLHYRLPRPGAAWEDPGEVLFDVTDLKGKDLRLFPGLHNEPSVCVEQLTLNFSTLLGEWLYNQGVLGEEYISAEDYDVVIMEICPETNKVILDIGLIFLTHLENNYRPIERILQSNVQVSWDLNTGLCSVIGASDVTDKGEGRLRFQVTDPNAEGVWSSFRKSAMNTVMECLVPEISPSYEINHMTNEALPEGVLADSDRCTWVLL